MGAVRDLRLLLTGRDFRRLFSVRVSSQFTDGLFQVALASYVLFSPERQATPTAIAAGFAALLLPFSLLGPFTGVFIDRWSRRQVLVWSNWVRVPIVLVVAALAAGGAEDLLLFVAVLVALSVNRFLLAALSAALPHVVDRDRLVMANALTPTSGTAAYLLGVAVGGALHELAGAAGLQPDVTVLALACLGYAAAGGLATRIARTLLGPDHDPQRPSIAEHTRHVLLGLRDGLRHLRGRRPAAAGLAAIGAHRFFFGLTTVMTIVLYRSYFTDAADLDAGFRGLATAVLCTGAGFVTAALVTPWATGRIPLRAWVLTLLLVSAAVLVFPSMLFTEPAVLSAAFVLGLAAQGIKIAVDTLVQVGVDDAYRGRVFAIYDVIFNVAFVAAAAVAAAVLPVDGRSYPLLALAAGGCLVTALAYARESHHSRSAALASSGAIGP